MSIRPYEQGENLDACVPICTFDNKRQTVMRNNDTGEFISLIDEDVPEVWRQYRKDVAAVFGDYGTITVGPA